MGSPITGWSSKTTSFQTVTNSPQNHSVGNQPDDEDGYDDGNQNDDDDSGGHQDD